MAESQEASVDKYPANEVMLFKGFRYDPSRWRDKLVEEWEIKDTGEVLHFIYNKQKRGSYLLWIGGLYNAWTDGNGNFRIKDRKPHNHFEDKNAITKWDSMSRSARQDYEAERRIVKNYIKEAVAPIREAYHGMRGPQKAQLIADVVRYITS